MPYAPAAAPTGKAPVHQEDRSTESPIVKPRVPICISHIGATHPSVEPGRQVSIAAKPVPKKEGK